MVLSDVGLLEEGCVDRRSQTVGGNKGRGEWSPGRTAVLPHWDPGLKEGMNEYGGYF